MSDYQRSKGIEKEAILLKRGLVRSCTRCGGKGRIQGEDYNLEIMQYKTFPCWCYKRYRYMLDLMIAGVPEKEALEVVTITPDDCYVVEIDLATGKPKGKKKKLYKKHLRPYAENIDEVIAKGYSYLYVGVNSTGKTLSALKMLHYFLRMGRSGHFIKARKLMKIINKTIAGGSHEKIKAEKLLQEILHVDLLVLDELGKETGNRDHIAGEIDEILKDRDMARMPTFVITNRDFENVESLYDSEEGKSAIISAFMRSYKLLIFDPSNDFRKKERGEWFD